MAELALRIRSGDGGLSRLDAGAAVATAACWALLLTLAWSFWPFGSNRFGALHLLAACAGLIAAAAIAVEAARGPSPLWRALTAPILLGLSVLGWAWWQAHGAAPAGWAFPGWALAQTALGAPIPATVAIDPAQAAVESTKLALAGAAFVTAALLARDAARARLMLAAIAAICSLYALYGLAGLAFGIDHAPLSLAEGPYFAPDGRAAGPFANANSFATAMGLGALTALLIVLRRLREVVTGRGVRLLVLTGTHVLFSRTALWLAALLLCSGALLASGSRGGALAFAAALPVVLISAARGRSRGRIGAVAAAAGALAIAILALSGDTLGARFDRLTSADNGDAQGRVALWLAAADGVAARPWLGYGLGGFERASELALADPGAWSNDRVHNDWIELAFGLGLPMALMWWTACGLIVWRCWRGVRERTRDKHLPALGLAAAVFAGAHAVTDFSLAIPAVACLTAVLLGIAFGQSFPRRSL